MLFFKIKWPLIDLIIKKKYIKVLLKHLLNYGFKAIDYKAIGGPIKTIAPTKFTDFWL